MKTNGFKKGVIPWNKGKKGEYKLWPNGRVYSAETRMKMGSAMRGKKHSEETKLKIGLAQLGHPVSEETKRKIAAKNSILMKGKRNSPSTEFKKGQTSPNKGKRCPWAKSNHQTFKKGMKPWNTGKKCPGISGENHPNWKGGKTPENLKIRGSLEYKLWREAVFKRDGYACVWCGDDRGGNLQADHIKPFAFFPELRLALDNGRTLCSSCHKKTDTWGERAKRYQSSSAESI